MFGYSSKRVAVLPEFLRVESCSVETSIRFLRLSLHAGESEAIALALELGIDRILLDDKQARETADRLGLNVIGTLGVLMLAKEKGHIKQVRPLIMQMIDRISFRIAPAVLNRALILLNEPPT